VVPEILISEKDKAAPSLKDAENLKILPNIEECKNFIKTLQL
jgi:hypothetical protein